MTQTVVGSLQQDGVRSHDRFAWSHAQNGPPIAQVRVILVKPLLLHDLGPPNTR
ncbi:hypothetical protein Hanom_Chr13g01235101 [Helianthus anomalus]